ncbi:hypothetical protein KM043_004825 [Ampulex compressa]|nr:hypothetical protein KM043_004825 [Ampulex compressa]
MLLKIGAEARRRREDRRSESGKVMKFRIDVEGWPVRVNVIEVDDNEVILSIGAESLESSLIDRDSPTRPTVVSLSEEKRRGRARRFQPFPLGRPIIYFPGALDARFPEGQSPRANVAPKISL